MAFKLGKCRLCLKLGDFYSIFTVDNNIQLAEMAMACSQIKVFEGDGLPDKVCVECIEKLSSSYVFKQQCERSDQELRRNYVPPPGFSETPPPNRQSSDSGFSNRTDESSKAGSSTSEEPPPVTTPAKPAKPLKRGRENDKSLLEESYSVKTSISDNKDKNTIKMTFNKEKDNAQKRPRMDSVDSDFDYAPSQHYSEDSDTQSTFPDEPLAKIIEKEQKSKDKNTNKETTKKVIMVKCVKCDKTFTSNVGLSNHSRTCQGNKLVDDKQYLKSPKVVDNPSLIPSCITPEKYKSVLGPANVVVCIPPLELQTDIEGQPVSCEKCGKTFKLKIMLKKHQETCGDGTQCDDSLSQHSTKSGKVQNNVAKMANAQPRKSNVGAVAPKLDQTPSFSAKTPIEITLTPKIKEEDLRVETCQYCQSKFKTISNLEKHLGYAHGAVLSEADKQRKKLETKLKRKPIQTPVKESDKQIAPVPCLFCKRTFTEYYTHAAHYHVCPKMTKLSLHTCTLCSEHFGSKRTYFKHLSDRHFPATSKAKELDESDSGNVCRMCNKSFQDQDSLVTHLAAHMSNLNEEDVPNQDISSNHTPPATPASAETSVNNTSDGKHQCPHCSKSFKYQKALGTHILAHHTEVNQETNQQDAEEAEQIKVEPELAFDGDQSDEDQEPSYNDAYEQREDYLDNTCDICERQFSYRKALLIHKKRKHNAGSGLKRSKIDIKQCVVKCLICDFTTIVKEINIHNKMHIANNVHPKNQYTCSECGNHFASLDKLRQHMIYHRESVRGGMAAMPNLAELCEVVVAPEDAGRAEGEGAEAVETREAAGNFLCPICSKDMGNVVSLRRHVSWHAHRGKAMSKDYKCEVCSETFKFKGHMRAHMSKHYQDTSLDPRLLTCAICNRRSKHLRAANAHAAWHRQTRFQGADLQCSICKRVFAERKNYICHMKVKHKNDYAAVIGLRDSSALGQGQGQGGASAQELEKNQCHICLKVCDTENSLKCHLSWHSSATSLFGNRYECRVCHVQFTNKRTHELHVRAHYEDDNGPYKCPICGKGFTNDIVCSRHVKGHNFDNRTGANDKRRAYIEKLREKKVKCPICVRYYPDMVKLVRHLRRSHPESKMIKEDPDAPPAQLFYCKLCAQVFHSEYRLQMHTERHMRKCTFYKCKFCGTKTASRKRFNVHIKGHLTANFKDAPLSCPRCDEKFVKGWHLHWHLRDVHGINETWQAELGTQPLQGPVKELQCAICYKFLSSKYLYSKHIDYHNTQRCNYCLEYFPRKNMLNGHIAFSCEKKKLLGETEVYPKKVKCYVCYKAFHVQIKLDCHMKTKHGIEVAEKNFKSQKESVCDYCFQVYENEDALASHKLYHRTIATYGCKYCPKRFATITGYNKHKTTHMSCTTFFDDPFKCDHCEEKFPAFRDMIAHMVEAHNESGEFILMPKEDTEEMCTLCNKKFFNLPKHLQYHEENRCKKCREYFFSRNDYDEHLCSIESDNEEGQVDEEGKPTYQECDFCFKPLTKTSSKLKHDKIHRAAGFISCRFCPTNFKTMDAFKIHAFSHRSRNYRKKPLKCRHCNEHFIKYGPFMKHMRAEHNVRENSYYRCSIQPEPCVVCGDAFPNLMNHYRAHLAYRCHTCLKYFTSHRLYEKHSCDTEDADPSKVFTCNADLNELIATYKPKEEYYENKYYDDNDKQEDEVNGFEKTGQIDEESQNGDVDSQHGDKPRVSTRMSDVQPGSSRSQESAIDLDEESQEVEIAKPVLVKVMKKEPAATAVRKPVKPTNPVYDNYIDTHSPIISEVLSLAKEEMSVEEIMMQMQNRAEQNAKQDEDVVEILENDDDVVLTSIIISDDDD